MYIRKRLEIQEIDPSRIIEVCALIAGVKTTIQKYEKAQAQRSNLSPNTPRVFSAGRWLQPHAGRKVGT